MAERGPGRRKQSLGSSHASGGVPITEVESVTEARLSTGIPEFDRVLGGGIVPGSVVGVGGDPGIGKSTLMLRLASVVQGGEVVVGSGVESAAQSQLRAGRLGSGLRPELG